jgi:single-strand DNA-binding protein
MLPSLHGTGRLTADPEIRRTEGKQPVGRISLAFNARKQDESGQWIDVDVCYLYGKLFGRAAESAATLKKGAEIVVTGRLHTQQWTAEDGSPRSALELLVDSFGTTVRQPAGARQDDPVSMGADDEHPF